MEQEQGHPPKLTPEQMKANRKRLIAALRAPMPKGFHWDFREVSAPHECGTAGCAIGLAMEIGLIDGEAGWPNPTMLASRLAIVTGLSHANSGRIFLAYDSEYENVKLSDVSPEMVATALEAAP